MRRTLLTLALTLWPLAVAAEDLVVLPFAGTTGGRGLVDAVGLKARFRSPRGIATAPDGSLYIADAQNHALRRLDLEHGNVTTIATSFEWPEGVAVDHGGRIYVSDQIGGTVSLVMNDGNVVTIASGFTQPCGLAADDAGNVYVADPKSGRVWRIASASITTFMSGLDQPFALAFDRAGTLYVGTLGGSILTSKRTVAEGLGEIGGIGVAEDGTIFVTQRLAGTVQRIGNDGRVLAATKLEEPVGIAVVGDHAFVAESHGAVVDRLNGDGLLFEIAGSRPEQGMAGGVPTDARFISPLSLTMKGDDLVAADIDAGTVRRITPSGYVFNLASGLAAPRAVAADAAENVYVAVGNQVQRVSDGVATLGTFRTPSAIAFDPNGNMLIADADSIRRVNGGTVANIRGASSLAFDGFGNLYAADGIAVRRVTPDGAVSTVAGPFATPYAVAVDRHGNLWVADATAHAVWMFDRSGNLAASSNVFDQPAGIVTDTRGNVFIADSASHAIRVAGLRGDVNGDFVVDGSDAATLQSYLKSRDTTWISFWADVNGDGRVDAADFDALIRLIALRRRASIGH